MSLFTEEVFEGADIDMLVQFERRDPVFEFLQEVGYQYTPRIGQTNYLEGLRDDGDVPLTIAPTISFSSGDGYEGQTIFGVSGLHANWSEGEDPDHSDTGDTGVLYPAISLQLSVPEELNEIC